MPFRLQHRDNYVIADPDVVSRCTLRVIYFLFVEVSPSPGHKSCLSIF